MKSTIKSQQRKAQTLGLILIHSPRTRRTANTFKKLLGCSSQTPCLDLSGPKAGARFLAGVVLARFFAVLGQFANRMQQEGMIIQRPRSWTIDGIDRQSVYFVYPCGRKAYFEERHKRPKLEIERS